MIERIFKKKKMVHFSAMEKYMIWNGDIFHKVEISEKIFIIILKGLLHNFSLYISLRI